MPDTRQTRSWARRCVSVAVIVALGVATSSLASSAPAAGTPTRVVDTETVYVVADASGRPRDTIVVDWLHVEGTGTFELADPAPAATAVESLTDGFSPTQAGEAVVATVDVDGSGDFFYRTKTSAQLPLEVRVRYWLDGREVAPDELAGRSGRLRMEIAIHNRLERLTTVRYVGADGEPRSEEVTFTVPLLCIPQVEIDGTKMTNVTPPATAQRAVTGSTQTYAVPMVPAPEATAAFEMDAKDIEIAPLVISVFPKLPASPDFSVERDLARLRDALTQLRDLATGHLRLARELDSGVSSLDLSGAAGAAEGLAALEGGLGELATAARGLVSLADGQYAYLDGVIAGINTSQFASVGELLAALDELTQGAEGMANGAAALGSLLDAQLALAEQVQALGQSASARAHVLAARYPQDLDAQALVAELGQQSALLAVLIDGGDLGSGYVPGLRATRQQLADLAQGAEALRAGLAALAEQATALEQVPVAFDQLKASLVVLRDGGTVAGRELPGLRAASQGAAGVASGLDKARAGLASSEAALAQLKQAPRLMDELRGALSVLVRGGTVAGRQVPGLDTSVEALGETARGLGDGLEGIRKGEAVTEAMKAAADAYTSFLGLPDGAEGHLGFLFRLDGVSR